MPYFRAVQGGRMGVIRRNTVHCKACATLSPLEGCAPARFFTEDLDRANGELHRFFSQQNKIFEILRLQCFARLLAHLKPAASIE